MPLRFPGLSGSMKLGPGSLAVSATQKDSSLSRAFMRALLALRKQTYRCIRLLSEVDGVPGDRNETGSSVVKPGLSDNFPFDLVAYPAGLGLERKRHGLIGNRVRKREAMLSGREGDLAAAIL